MNNNLGIKELARLAQVSIGTVDRVLHNRSGVALETKEKVLKIVEETGYKKNVMASRLKLASTKAIKIAILVPETKNEWSYWNLPLNGVSSAVKELSEFGISAEYFFFDLFNPTTFNNSTNKIFESEFDALVTVPFFKEESNLMLNEAKKKKIPIVFLDTQRELDLSANFIGQNSNMAGQVAARLLHGLVGNEAEYFVVNILNERGKQINNSQRENGFRQYFKENFPNRNDQIHVINHPLEDIFDLGQMTNVMMKSDVPKGIFVTNARSFLLPDILKELKIVNTRIVGFDVNHKNLAYLKSGDIDFLIHQKPQYQGYSAIKGLYKYLTENDNSLLNIDIPIEIVVKENASFFE